MILLFLLLVCVGDNLKCIKCTSADPQATWCKGGKKDMKDKAVTYTEANCESSDEFCMVRKQFDNALI